MFLFFNICSKAATIYVNYSTGNDLSGNGTSGNPYKTFHKAYTSSSANDTINLTGTFTWTNTDETGDATTSGYTISKSLTIIGQTAASTIIQASSTVYTANCRIFSISGSGTTVTIQNLTIRYGYMSNADYEPSAIDMGSGSVLTILNTILDLNANNGRFSSGAIEVNGTGKFIMRNSVMSNNNGVVAQQTVGGSWYGYTGAIDMYGTNTGNEITNTTFFANGAQYNGAIYMSASGGKLTITNSTFIGNKGITSSADILAWSGIVYLANNIFAQKASGATNSLQKGSGSFTDGGNNIIETQTSAGFTNGVNGNLVGVQASLNIASSLATNSATTTITTLALSSGSVAINAGTTTANNGISIPALDARQFTRDVTPDIGAFEYNGTVFPTSYNTNTFVIRDADLTNNSTSSDGLWMQKITPSLVTGNHAYYGNNNISGLNGSDLANSGCQIRSGKIWYVDVTGTVSTTNVIIDISAATGVSLVTAETATNYKLLYRSGTSGDFTELAIGTSITSTDNVNFSPSALSTGYYALGVIDGFAAPDYTTSTYYLWITSGTSITTSSDGLWMQKISPALSTGNHVYYGNNNTSGFSTSDLTTSLCQLRTGRIWYVDVTGTVSTTNVIIDNSVATGTSITAATASNYKLLHRATTTGDFTVLATGASIASTDNITFSSVTLTTGYYALGTLNATSSPLPVELKSFTANIRNGIVNLNWTTATETANFGFDIERKSGNGNWIKLGFVKGNGTSASEKNYTFTDATVRKGKYSYRLKQIDRDGKFQYQNEASVIIGIEPRKIVLDENFPNPFNPTTKISFMLGTTAHATLKVYDLLGKEIATLADGIFQENEIQEVNFNANNLTSGIYYYKLQSNNQTEIKKMVLMK